MSVIRIKIVISSYVLFYYLIQKCAVCYPKLHQITRPFGHAEGPFWDSRTGILYFVDIHAGDIHAWEYSTNEIHTIHLNGEVSPVIPSKTDPEILIVGVNRTVVAVEWDGKSKIAKKKPLTTVAHQFPNSRFNDGKADKRGRLWFGTMGFEDAAGVAPNQGALYKITRRNLRNPTVMVAPVNISNGLVWNKANDKFYYIDTPTRKVMQYDYEDTNGIIRNGRVVFDFSQNEAITGFPDGMTIDKDDNLWIALYGGGAVIQVNPRQSKLLQIVAIPAEAVTSVMWGGPQYETLFVTTSRFRLTKEQSRKQSAAGSVFAITDLGIAGQEVFHADIIDALF